MINYKLFDTAGKFGKFFFQKANASKLSLKKAPRPGEVITTICGATSPAGEVLALELKQCPFFREVRLYDTTDPLGIAVDLKHINTLCRVRSYRGPTQLRHAVKDAHIVVFIGGKYPPPDKPPESVFDENAEMVQSLAIQCAKYNSEAILVIAVPPVNSLVPMVAEVFRENNCLNPNKILGLTTIESIRMKCLVAERQGLTPSSINVPIIGGASPNTLVPVLSNAKPHNCFYMNEAAELTDSLRGLNEQIGMAKRGKPLAQSPGYAAAVFVADVTRGLTSMPHTPHCAYVRSNALQPLRYIATPLVFGPCGVSKNFGVPKLNSLEVQLLERALPVLESDIQRGEDYVKNPSTKYSVSDAMDLCNG